MHYCTHYPSRVEYVDGYVDEVGDEEHVALRASTATLSAEGLLIGKTEQQQPNVVGQDVEGGVEDASGLLEVAGVSGEGEEEMKMRKLQMCSYQNSGEQAQVEEDLNDIML